MARKQKTRLKISPILLAISSIGLTSISLVSNSSIVRDDINYQYFRDFAENKGQFRVNATNINIFDRQGQNVGMMMQNHRMHDFNSVAQRGFTTLTSGQYLTSVRHNSGYDYVKFGGITRNSDAQTYTYTLVARNEFSRVWDGEELPGSKHDYHAPRLNKLVTEAAPAPLTEVWNTKNDPESLQRNQDVLDSKKFSSTIRIGTGTQSLAHRESYQVTNDNGEVENKFTTWVQGAYSYLTGGGTVDLRYGKGFMHISGNGVLCT